MTPDLMAARLRPDYNCAHFVADAWERETGRDIRSIMTGFLAAPGLRRAPPQLREDFIRYRSPVSPCIVIFRRVKATTHAGIFVRGKVLHLTDQGPIRQLLATASIGYTSVRFYAPN